MGNNLTFRLINQTPNTFQIKQENAFGHKEESGEKIAKQIAYYPGRNSIFIEDNIGITPTAVPEFEFNSATNQTELTVSATNKNLIAYLKTHAWYGSRFELHNADLEAEKDLVAYDGIERAMTFVSGKNDNEMKALALLVFGESSLANSPLVNKQKLMKTAVENPNTIINLTNEVDFKTLYVGAMAFVLGIVQNDSSMTSVRWKDNNGLIIRVATGESPVRKLGEYLTSNTDDSNATLQELANKMDASKKVVSKTVDATSTPVIDESEKDNQIAELQAKLDKLEAEKKNSEVIQEVTDTQKESSEAIEDEKTNELVDNVDYENMDVETLRSLYFEKYNKEVAAVKKNDAAWIISKLRE